MPVVNLFDMSKNFQKGSQDWLMKRYLSQQQEDLEPTDHTDPEHIEREKTIEQTGVPNPSLATTPGASFKTRESTMIDHTLETIIFKERVAETA